MASRQTEKADQTQARSSCDVNSLVKEYHEKVQTRFNQRDHAINESHENVTTWTNNNLNLKRMLENLIQASEVSSLDGVNRSERKSDSDGAMKSSATGVLQSSGEFNEEPCDLTKLIDDINKAVHAQLQLQDKKLKTLRKTVRTLQTNASTMKGMLEQLLEVIEGEHWNDDNTDEVDSSNHFIGPEILPHVSDDDDDDI